MIRVGIVGASGYTGVELARLLCGCAGVSLTVATSRQYKGKHLADVYPSLAGLVDIVCEDVQEEELAERLGVRVRIRERNGKGVLSVEFYSTEDFERLRGLLLGRTDN